MATNEAAAARLHAATNPTASCWNKRWPHRLGFLAGVHDAGGIQQKIAQLSTNSDGRTERVPTSRRHKHMRASDQLPRMLKGAEYVIGMCNSMDGWSPWLVADVLCRAVVGTLSSSDLVLPTHVVALNARQFECLCYLSASDL